MKSTRHTLLAVLVILVILIVLLTAAVETAPEIIIPPSNETVYSGDTKEFTCHTRNANYAEWKLNGTASLISSNDVTVSLNGGNIANGFNTTLTIKARLEYHGLVIKCVAVMVDGDTVVRMSKNAILMVQGLLDPVSDVKVKSGSDSILLSWRPPYSLNVTGVEPDIWYNIIITNITDDMPVPCSDCHNLTQPHYTFTTTNPSPCHKYNFTIISLNGAGEGGRSEPVEAFFRSDSTAHTSSIAVTPTPSGEPEREMQNMQSPVIISSLVITIIIITIASTAILLMVILWKRRKAKLFILPTDIGCRRDPVLKPCRTAVLRDSGGESRKEQEQKFA